MPRFIFRQRQLKEFSLDKGSDNIEVVPCDVLGHVRPLVVLFTSFKNPSCLSFEEIMEELKIRVEQYYPNYSVQKFAYDEDLEKKLRDIATFNKFTFESE